MIKKREYKFILLLLLSMFFWGASWVSGKYITSLASYSSVVYWRFVLTTLFMIPALLLFRVSLAVKLNNIPQILFGSILILCHATFFFQGLSYGLAGAGSILFTMMVPLLTFIITIIFFKHKLTSNEVIGLFLGIIGGVVLLKLWRFSFDELVSSGNLYFLMASLAWASITVLTQKSYKNLSPLLFSFYISLVGLIVLSMVFSKEVIFTPALENRYFWMHIIFLSIFANVFASTIYYYASGVIGSHKASSFIYLVPIFAVILGISFLDEKIEWTYIVGGLITFTAVYLINKRKE